MAGLLATLLLLTRSVLFPDGPRPVVKRPKPFQAPAESAQSFRRADFGFPFHRTTMAPPIPLSIAGLSGRLSLFKTILCACRPYPIGAPMPEIGRFFGIIITIYW